MGLMDFVKEAGEKLFGHGPGAGGGGRSQGGPWTTMRRVQAANARCGRRDPRIHPDRISSPPPDGASNHCSICQLPRLSVFGVAPDQETKEKIVALLRQRGRRGSR